MASPAAASVDAASARNGGFGACGEIGSENEAIPGQCRVVVACGNPTPNRDGKVRKTAGSPCATSFEFISPQYEASDPRDEALDPRGKQTVRRGAGGRGQGQGSTRPVPGTRATEAQRPDG